MGNVYTPMAANAYRKALNTCNKAGFAPKLLYLLTTEKLEAEVARAHAEIDRLNALLDAWEIANPLAAAMAPWAETRQAWKDAGRPRAPWYELIRWSVPILNRMPLSEIVIDRRLYGWQPRNWQRKRRLQLKRLAAQQRSSS